MRDLYHPANFSRAETAIIGGLPDFWKAKDMGVFCFSGGRIGIDRSSSPAMRLKRPNSLNNPPLTGLAALPKGLRWLQYRLVLVTVGILAAVNHKFTWVREISVVETNEALEVRAVLEALATHQAAGPLRDRREDLRGLANEIVQTDKRCDFVRFQSSAIITSTA